MARWMQVSLGLVATAAVLGLCAGLVAAGVLAVGTVAVWIGPTVAIVSVLAMVPPGTRWFGLGMLAAAVLPVVGLARHAYLLATGVGS